MRGALGRDGGKDGRRRGEVGLGIRQELDKIGDLGWWMGARNRGG